MNPNHHIEQRTCTLLSDYAGARIDEAELIDRLGELGAEAAGVSNDELASKLSQLAARIEMIHLSVCAAEQRAAIEDVIDEFEALDRERLDKRSAAAR